MHVSVTALGARADQVGAAAGAIVNYLKGGVGGDMSRAGSDGACAPGLGQEAAPGNYYSDSSEAPGRWRGNGTADLGAEVDVEHFRHALLGQHPRSGQQLVSPQGSAGRAKNHPSAAVLGPPDELVGIVEAAKLAGVDASYLRRLARQSATYRSETTPPTDTHSPPTGPNKKEDLGTYLSAQKVDGKWMVSRGEVARFMEARSQPQVVMAYDVTFSAPKSLSILWATGDEPTRQLCEDAFEAGVASGMAYLETNAVWVRRKRDHQPASNMIAASYRHSTSRELEPQLHEHVVVANMGTNSDGGVQALDGRGLFAHATTAGYLAEAEMQHFCNRSGIAWTPTRQGIADVVGVSHEAINSVSTRRAQILNLTSELTHDSANARQTAAIATRAAKTTGVDNTELKQNWRHRLAHAGFGPTELEAATTAAPISLWTPTDSKQLDSYLAGSSGVTEQKSVFDRRDVIQAIVDRTSGRLSADEVEAHADRWLHTEAVIPLGPQTHSSLPGLAKEGSYTTPTMIRIEQAITDGYESGHDTDSAVVSADVIANEIETWETATGHRLGEDQRSMVHAICDSGDRFQAVVGPAGSGKTAALEIAARSWEAAGYEVIGAAVNGTAAEVLQRSTGVPSRTVAGLVTRLDTSTQPVLSDKTVILVDEASTLGNRPHARLIHHVQSSGAAMRTIGDPAQHSSVEAGGMWARMVEMHPERTPRLTQNRRQASEKMTDVRLANADYRNGRINEAIERLRSNDRIVTAPTSSELLDQVAADWFVDHKTDPAVTSRMIAEHHRERRALNTRAQALLKADGMLSGPGVEIAESVFHIGDQVISRTPNRSLHPEADKKAYVRNGTPGIVTDIKGPAGNEYLVVDFEHRGPIDVPRDWLTTDIRPGVTGGLAPSYAVTSHAAQGDTYRAGRMVATNTAAREAVYVGLTRGTTDTRIYSVAAEPKTIETDPRLPRIEDTRTAIEALSDQLNKSQPAETVAANAPDANLILDLTGQSISDLESSDHPAANRATEIVANRIAHHAQASPGPAVVARIGHHNQHSDPSYWNAAVRETALHQARHGGQPGTEVPEPVHKAMRAAEISFHADNTPTHELAERRAALVAQARQAPSDNIRLTRIDHDTAISNFAEAKSTHRLAERAHKVADSGRGKRRDPDIIELTRRDLHNANQRLSEAESAVAATGDRLRRTEARAVSNEDISEQITVIDEALEPRIRAAVASPDGYITETLGPRSSDDNESAWVEAATGIETYRHTTLGISPEVGAIDPESDHPAIGQQPTDSIKAEPWLDVVELISAVDHRVHTEPLNISR